MSSSWQGDLLLSKHLDLVSHDVDSSTIREPSSNQLLPEDWLSQRKRGKGKEGGNSPLVRSVQLQDSLLVGIPEQSVSETVDTRRLSDTRHSL